MPEAVEDRGLGVFAAPRGAERQVFDRQKALNYREVPPVLEIIEQLSKEKQVYIFNVGPWNHMQYVGAGAFNIPACPEGKAYSEPVILPGIFGHLYPNDEKTMRRIDEDGWKVAQDILGIGPGLSPRNSLTRYGVSACKQWPPSKSEVAQAWEALRQGEFADIIKEANSAAAQGEKAMEQTINERHFQVARILKKTKAECPWTERATANTSNNVDCKFCGDPIKPNLAKCPNCKEIINKELYEKLTA